jgi:hypothetical protein
MVGYYNGFMICWIKGFVLTDKKIENKKVGICNFFLVKLMFPTSSNQSGLTEKFDNIKASKKYTVEMFNDFKKLINI